MCIPVALYPLGTTGLGPEEYEVEGSSEGCVERWWSAWLWMCRCGCSTDWSNSSRGLLIIFQSMRLGGLVWHLGVSLSCQDKIRRPERGHPIFFHFYALISRDIGSYPWVFDAFLQCGVAFPRILRFAPWHPWIFPSHLDAKWKQALLFRMLTFMLASGEARGSSIWNDIVAKTDYICYVKGGLGMVLQ